MKHLNELMVDRGEEAEAYRNNKKKQPQSRLGGVGNQASAAQNQELSDLKEIPVYKIMNLGNCLTDA